jgi:hypothetical protein
MADHEVNDQVNGQNPPSDVESEESQDPPTPPSVPAPSSVLPAPSSVLLAPSSERPAPLTIHRGTDLPSQEHSSVLVWRYARQFGFQSLLWLQFLWALLTQVGSVAQSVSTGVLRGLQGHVYVFFQGSTYPYRLYDYTLTGPGVPAAEWYYDADKKIFYSASVYNTTTEYELHHLEWLSGQIRYNNLMLYDVSEYLQQVKWAGPQRPSAAHVLSAWAIHSGIVLTLLDGITLSTINEDASESNVPVRG